MDIPYFIRRFTPSFFTLFLLSTLFILSGCGGGGDGGDDSDTTPNAFTFTDLSDQDLSTVVTSQITVQGINRSVAISISGNDGEYSLDGGTTFTNAAGTVTNNQTVTVLQTSSSAFSTATTTTLTVGSVSDDFVVTTLAQDIEPDSFTFVDQTDVNVSTSITAAAVTISGINDATPISIVGGEYSLDGGTTFTSAAGTVTNNQAVTVRQTSSNLPSTETIATLTVGSVSDDFNVTTLADTQAPVVTIAFPTPVSLTDSSAITVRGSATDLSNITGLQVNGIEATSSDGFATWLAEEVPLTDGQDNTLTVSVEDSLSNSSSNAAQVVVRRDLLTGNFPVGSAPALSAPHDIAVDLERKRAWLVDTDLDALLEVDLNTGLRTVISDATVPTAPNNDNAFGNPEGISVNSDGTLAWVIDRGLRALLEVDLTTGIRTVLSDENIPNDDNEFGQSTDIIVNGLETQAWVSDTSLDRLMAVDLATGTRTIISDDNVPLAPNNGNPFVNPDKIAIDEASNRAWVVDIDRPGLIEVDLNTGIRTVVSDANIPSAPNNANPLVAPQSVDIDVANNRAWVGDVGSQALLQIDLLTGQRTIISDATTPAAPINGVALDSARDMFVDLVLNRAWVAEDTLGGLVVIDLITGQRVIVSK